MSFRGRYVLPALHEVTDQNEWTMQLLSCFIEAKMGPKL